LLSVFFAAINGWITSCLFWRETRSVFIAKNTVVFSLFVQRLFSFSSTVFSFRFFALIFCSDLVISLYQGVFRPMVYVGFHI
jgi:hypothetical protein